MKKQIKLSLSIDEAKKPIGKTDIHNVLPTGGFPELD